MQHTFASTHECLPVCGITGFTSKQSFMCVVASIVSEIARLTLHTALGSKYKHTEKGPQMTAT